MHVTCTALKEKIITPSKRILHPIDFNREKNNYYFTIQKRYNFYFEMEIPIGLKGLNLQSQTEFFFSKCDNQLVVFINPEKFFKL